MRVALLLVIACGRGVDPIEAALLARGPAPISISADGARTLIESPLHRGVRYEIVAGGAVLARRDGDPMIAPLWRGDGQAIAYFHARQHHHVYELRIWDFATGDRALAAPVTSAAYARFAPDGRLAYLADPQRTLTVAGHGLVRVAEHAEAEWSPEGARIATAAAAAPGALCVIDVRSGERTELPVIDGELEDLAWSPDGATLAVTGRARGDERFRVYLVRLADGAVDALPAVDGDAHAPQYVGGALAYHVERDGERRIYLGGHAIGRADASARLVGFDGRPRIVYRSRTGAAALDAPGPARGPAGVRIAIASGDGTSLPAYLWRAPRATGAVVIVHGGPALHATPAWNERTQLLIDAGLDVIKLDYRGSTGHGAAFEALAGLAGRVADVAAARDWAVGALGLAADRVIVVGESYGAGLVAASDVAARSPIVLISTQPLAATGAPARYPVLAFHGADDDIAPPDVAHQHLLRRFGAGVRWRLLPEEGHNLTSTASWAIVYRAILGLR